MEGVYGCLLKKKEKGKTLIGHGKDGGGKRVSEKPSIILLRYLDRIVLIGNSLNVYPKGVHIWACSL